MLVVQPVPTPAPAAIENGARRTAVQRNALAVYRLRQIVVLPTVFPNPLAFNIRLVVIDKTSAVYRKAQMLAATQRIQALRAAALARQVRQNPGAQNALEQQMRRMLEPVLRSELSFACRAAGVSDNERRSLIVAGKKWFDTFVVEFINKQDPNQRQMLLQGMQGVWFGPRQRGVENPRDALTAGVAKLVAATLPKEKVAAYDAECRKREEFERQVSAENIVERLDEKVKLSPAQRKKIDRALNEHWDKDQAPQLEAFVISTSIWPGVPNEWVLPELSSAQRTVLQRINTTTASQVFFGGGVFGGMMGVNDVIDDIDLDADQPADNAKPNAR
ncbi:MAG TPA: hypothetical protein VHE81_13220 [Lacipirellulaceae bacterium]|nr:hypothetical protein [Lacipirellulaceae bacterium]